MHKPIRTVLATVLAFSSLPRLPGRLSGQAHPAHRALWRGRLDGPAGARNRHGGTEVLPAAARRRQQDRRRRHPGPRGRRAIQGGRLHAALRLGLGRGSRRAAPAQASLRPLHGLRDRVPDVDPLDRARGAGLVAAQDAGRSRQGGEGEGIHDRVRFDQGRLGGRHLPPLRQGGRHQGHDDPGCGRRGCDHQAGRRPRRLRRRAPERDPAAHEGRAPARAGGGPGESRRGDSRRADLQGAGLRRGDRGLGEGCGRAQGHAAGSHQVPGEEVPGDRRTTPSSRRSCPTSGSRWTT